MAAKPKITKETLLRHAYEIAVQDGIEAVTSRSVAKSAGCSVQPVFTHFPTMEDLRRETYRYACSCCAEELLSNENKQDFLAALTRWMIGNAVNRPNLFSLLYLSDICNVQSVPKSLSQSIPHQHMIRRISHTYHLSKEDSEDVLVRSCLFLMGVGTMLSVSHTDLSEETLEELVRKTKADFILGRQKVSPEEEYDF